LTAASASRDLSVALALSSSARAAWAKRVSNLVTTGIKLLLVVRQGLLSMVYQLDLIPCFDKYLAYLTPPRLKTERRDWEASDKI